MSQRTYRATGARGWLSPSDLVRLGAAVRAAIAADPEATVDELVAATRAPPNLVVRVRARLSTRSTTQEEHA